MYCRLYRERALSVSKLWWQNNFILYKTIRSEIENGLIEPELTRIQRQSNINLIDSILFYIKLMMLQISLRTEQRNQSAESS